MTEEIKIYVLWMNPMRENTEVRKPMAGSYDKDKLIAWYNEQKAKDIWMDEGLRSFGCLGASHKWHKTFKKGSVLEWYNPLENFEELNHHGIGLEEVWLVNNGRGESQIINFIN